MKGAWVTLATNDSYSLGALVLAHSLKQVGTTQELAILVTPGVTNSMRTRLSEVFNLVQEVNVLDSRDQSNLRLLQRPELGITFTKLHCWRLTQYEKCVFLDADTLVLQNCDELFDREEFSAAPDVGWPDCFNSGVFVYRPSSETYDKLIQFALDKGSFDGGDQGLLNLYFSDWAHKDISKHLPFIYNVCSTAFYSYLPAFKQFGKDVKILHFIGSAKPWLQYFDTETRKVRPSGDVGHLSAVLQRWWDIFCHMVHSNLSPDMSGLAGAFAKLTLGEHRTPEQEALENSLRRQNWEQGNIDYLGKDSFDNIWSKICETLSKGGAQKEEAVEGPQVVPLSTISVPQAATGQQVTEQRQSPQDIATAAETPKEEPQASETKESPVAPSPVQEVVTSPREEAVSMLPISEKDIKIPLDDSITQSSETPSKVPSETPSIVSPIPTDTVVTPTLSASAPLDVTEQKEPLKSTSPQAEIAETKSTTVPTKVSEVESIPATILQETVALQSQISEQIKETGTTISTPCSPVVPHTPEKLEEATQVISVPKKTSEAPVTAPVAQVVESSKSEPAAIVATSSAPKPLESAQTSDIVSNISTPVVPSSANAPSSLVQTQIAQPPTLTSQTPTQEASPAPKTKISPSKDISPPVQLPPAAPTSPTVQIPSAVPSSPVQITSAVPTSPPVPTPSAALTSPPIETIPPTETSTAKQPSVGVSVASADLPCVDKSIDPVCPQTQCSAKTSSPSVKPTELSSASVKGSVSKESQAPQSRDSAASTHVPSETKQAPSSPSANVDACPIAPPPRKSGGTKKQGKSKK